MTVNELGRGNEKVDAKGGIMMYKLIGWMDKGGILMLK